MFCLVFIPIFFSAANLSNNEPEPISNPLVYFQISIGGVVQPEKIIFKLFWEKNPITAENFKQLATGEPGFGYKNSIFHRIVEGFVCQGGDYERANGFGGESIYGGLFDDENLNDGNTFEEGGILAMANRGPNTNGSQFFITTGETTRLEGKHVKIGKVAFGYDTVLKMDKVETGDRNKPIQEVKIVYSGICNGHQDSPEACDNNAKNDEAGASGPSNTADVNATGTPDDKPDTDEKNSASSNFKMLIFALNIFYF